jgi:hypothetical protein
MPLPQAGNSISLNQVNVELGLTATAQISLNDAAVRSLFGKASGAISMSDGFGKSAGFSLTKTITTNTLNYNLLSDMVANGYTNGNGYTVNLTIASNVYVWSDSSTPGFDTGAITGTGTITLTNNGFIIGKGGKGSGQGSSGPQLNGTAGSAAMNIQRNITIVNNSYIAGGGGGGGCNVNFAGGGGGAGGGAGGDIQAAGGAGGAVGSTGANGVQSFYYPGSGGGGGRILPGVGGAGGVADINVNNGGRGGGAGGGGGGGLDKNNIYPGGSGGSAGNVGQGQLGAAAGGGGWGASGGAAQPSLPGAGGKCINLNGYTATFTVTGTRYGAIS